MSGHSLSNGSILLPNHSRFIHREGICKILKHSKNQSLIAVTAGAGYGKTAAVSDYLHNYSKQTVWLQLSPLDNLVTKFWDHFSQAASIYNIEMAKNLAQSDFPNSIKALDDFAQIISSYSSPVERFHIVLDDFHIINEPTILWFIENLVSIHVPNLTVVLISRTESGIRTAGLESKGLYTRIKEEHLRFSLEEIKEYYSLKGFNFSRNTLQNIYTVTEGWSFAIHLIGLSSRANKIDDLSYLETIKANIFKFIETEIFLLYPKSVQTSLIRLSLLENFPVGLVRELFADNTTFFTQWDNINSFIRYDNFTSSCHIHHLFGEFLEERQKQLTKSEKNSVYLCAANWYSNNGRSIDAILYYEKIGYYKEILEIIQLHYSSSSKETAQFILNLLERVPKNIADKNSMIRVFHAKYLVNSLQIDAARAECIKIRQEYENKTLSEEASNILGETCIIQALLGFFECLLTNEYKFKNDFEKANEYLPHGSKLVDNSYHLNVGVYACPASSKSTKGLSHAIEETIKSTPYITKVLNGCGLGNDYLLRTEIDFHKREFKSAVRNASQALNMAPQENQYDIEFMIHLYLLRTYIALAHSDKIDTILSQLEKLNKKYHTPLSNRLFDIVMGWYYYSVEQFNQIPSWIFDNEDHQKVMSIGFGLDRLLYARALLKSKKYSELLGYLNHCKNQYSLYLYLIGTIELKAMEAVALYNLKEKQEAFALLQQAYQLSQTDNLVMPFIELGTSMRTLTQTALKDNNCKIPAPWLKEISIKSSAYAKNLSRIQADYKNKKPLQNTPSLTQWEIEVLQNLCNGLTREEISENHNISINTIKSRMQNIYQKLGAINSYDAIRIATKYNILT